MKITDRDKEINLLLDSLSGIDGDLLMDVEPAKPKEGVRVTRGRKSWQHYTAVAASLLVLIGVGLVIRLALPGIGNKATKSADPKDLEMAEYYGQDSSKGDGNPVPGAPESISPEIDHAIRGAVLYEAVSIRRPLTLLQEEGQEDSIYSPLLLFLGLIELDGGTCEEVEWDFPQSPPLITRSSLVEPGLSVRERQVLLDDDNWPQAYENSMSTSERMDLLQDLDLDLTLRVMAEAGPWAEGGSAMVSGVSVYRKQDGTILAKLPAGDFSLHLALPVEGHSPEELLQEEGFLTDLLALEGREGQAGIRLAPFTVSASHDWYSRDLGEDLTSKGRIYQNVRLSVSLEALEPGLCLATMIEFDRPFVFAVSGTGKLPLLTGIIYPPAK